MQSQAFDKWLWERPPRQCISSPGRAAATHECGAWQPENLPCLHACRLIALPSGYHLATVDAVRELLSVQAQTVGTRMQPAQYGASPDWHVDIVRICLPTYDI